MKLECPWCSVECRITGRLVSHLIVEHRRTAGKALCEILGPLDRALDQLETKMAAKAVRMPSGAARVISGPFSPITAGPATPPPPVQPFQVACSDCRGLVGSAPTIEAARRICGSHIVRPSHSARGIDLAATQPKLATRTEGIP